MLCSGAGGLRPFPVAGGRGRCEPSQGELRSSWKPQTRFQTKPAAGKGQSQGRISGFRGTSLVHFAGGFCGLVLPGAIKNPSSLRWGPRRVLGPSCASAPCRVSFKLRNRRVEEGGCLLPVLHPEGCWRPGQIKRPAQNLQLSQDWDFSSLTQSRGSEPLLSAACRPPPGSRRTLPPRSHRWHHCPANVSFAPAPGLGVVPAAVSGETGASPRGVHWGGPGSKARAAVGQ